MKNPNFFLLALARLHIGALYDREIRNDGFSDNSEYHGPFYGIDENPIKNPDPEYHEIIYSLARPAGAKESR